MFATECLSSRPRAIVSVLVLVAALFLLAATIRPAHAAPLSPVVFQECSTAFFKNSSGLLKKRLTGLGRCSDALLECKLADELGSGDFATCSVDAIETCHKELDKAGDAETKALEKLAKVCSPLADYDFRTSVGLGQRKLAQTCGVFDTEAEAYDCLLSRTRCRANDITEALRPRTYELLNAAGLITARPQDAECLDVRAPVVAISGDATQLAECQSGLASTIAKKFSKTPKDVSSCVGDLLECQLHEERLRTNESQPPACFDEDAAKSCPAADKKVVAALAQDLVDKAGGDCASVSAADMKSALNFSLSCSSAGTVADVVDCARDTAAEPLLLLVDEAVPRTCELGDVSGYPVFTRGNFCTPVCGNNVLEDGEVCDDGNGNTNDTCTNACVVGPTAHQSVLIPATATPAHTPDGTVPNAVAPGSSVAIQFGTTTPNLNNASYVRYYAPGAGDPDAILVLIPGFAGGTHSLKIVAETMVAKAAADGDIVLEVWAFDRRTDQLEDDEGGELTEIEDDPDLGINWYFGDELGIPLDPRLDRRAVFHDGQDIPFIANFTYNMFIHDIDAVIDAAHAVASSPTVFLGGHSLGTLFSARYAATDLDPGVAVEPGYQKVAGLVLFEGGGDSLPTGIPSDDNLDLVIAKADGGLYHAIKDGAPRCWEGTPCTTNADCSSVTLATGALTNKCIVPVDAYAGAVISPQIHAIGDSVVVQARRHPDTLSVAQTKYGANTPIDVVPGLSLLDLLQPGSAEAAVGFFLDDDYSPEVSFQASMGISDNGSNTPLGDFYIGGPAFNDPYRLWTGIEHPQSADALTNHGAPTGTFDINGQEKEITPMANMLTMVRTGDRNIGDWYFPSAGLGVTQELRVFVEDGFTGGLDSTALSVTRGRPDIENLTEATDIDIPIIAFGGSNGISNTPGAFLGFAESIGTCASTSCNGTARIVTSDPVSPVYGGINGGFEAYISEGYAHIDIVSAEDDPTHNQVYAPLLAFLERNTN